MTDVIEKFEKASFAAGYVLAFDVDSPPSEDEIDAAYNIYGLM